MVGKVLFSVPWSHKYEKHIAADLKELLYFTLRETAFIDMYSLPGKSLDSALWYFYLFVFGFGFGVWFICVFALFCFVFGGLCFIF